MQRYSLRDALRRAESALEAKKTDEALAYCEQILAIKPNWFEALRVKADCYAALQKYAEAETLLTGSLSMDPEYVQAYLSREYVARLQSDWGVAAFCLRRACELTPQNGQIRKSYNQLAARLGRQPFTPSHSGLARLYMRSGLFEYALREWNIALDMNPKLLEAQLGAAETHWRMGNMRRAQEICRYAAQNNAQCVKAISLLAHMEFLSGHETDSIYLFTQASQFDPELLIAHKLLDDYTVAEGSHLRSLLKHVTLKAVDSIILTAPAPTNSRLATDSAVGNLFVPHPKTAPLPNGKLDTGPLFNSSTTTDAEPLQPQENQNAAEDYFSRSNASIKMPMTNAEIFKQTEIMLWGKESADDSTEDIEAIIDEKTQSAEPAGDAEDAKFIDWLIAQGAKTFGQTDPAAVHTPAQMPAANSAETLSETVAPPPFLLNALQQGDEHHNAANSSTLPEPDRADIPAAQSAEKPIDEHVTSIEDAVPYQNTTEDTAGSQNFTAKPTESATEILPLVTDSSANIHSELVKPEPQEQNRQQNTAITIEQIDQQLQSVGYAPLKTGHLAEFSAPDAEEDTSATQDQRLHAARAYRKDGRSSDAITEYGILMKTNADSQILISDLKDAALEFPAEPDIFRLLGDAHIRAGNYIEALEAYNRSSSLRQQRR